MSDTDTKIITNNVLFTVPSTKNVNEAIEPQEMQARITDIAGALATMHRGCTAQPGAGKWYANNGELVSEPVELVASDCTRTEAQANYNKLKELARDKAREWGQRSIRISSNGITEFVEADNIG